MVTISTLLNLLSYAVALLGVAPLFPYLDLPARLVFAAALPAAIVCDRRRRYPLRHGVATFVAIACFAFYLLQVSSDRLVEPAVNVLALLLAVRLLTEKSGRHYLQIFVLAVFALAASSLLTLSAAFFLYLVPQVTGVTVGLVLLSFHAADPALVLSRRQTLRITGTALLLPAVALLLVPVFFLVLPRTQYPLWNFLNPAAAATTGFAEEVRPGAFASLATAKKTALRVESERLRPDELYWRGTVLNVLEGSVWVRRDVPAAERARLSGGRLVRQTIYPEPGGKTHLFAVDVPLSVEGLRLREAGDKVFYTPRPLDQQVKYTAASIVGGTFAAAGNIDREFYLRVPDPVSARVREVGERIGASGLDAAGRIARLEAFFTGQQLAYATTDLPEAADPVDAFLFEKKRGYCEFFASSFAVLLRLSGVPARLVGGYYGGSYNEFGGYYLVTEETAHVWVEALVDGRWVRLDPSRLAQNAQTALMAPRGGSIRFDRSLADAVDYYWTRLVLTYDLGRQMQLLQQTNLRLRRLNMPAPSPRLLGYGLAAVAAAALLIAWLRRSRRSPEQRLLGQFLRQVRRRHRLEELPPAVGLRELAERVNDPLCREFAAIYGGALYRDRRLSADERRRLEAIIRALRERPG